MRITNFFPNNYKGALIISWDYELQKGADAVSKNWGIDDYLQTEKLLEILEKYSVKCVFYCLGYAATGDNLPYSSISQIKKISLLGHEVGSHGFSHEDISTLTKEQLEETLRKSKEVLEKATNKPVISFAAPYNRPFQFIKKFAFSKKYSKFDISDICKILKKTGYKTYRVEYKTIKERLQKMLFNIEELVHDIEIEQKEIFLFRISCHAGFDETSIKAVNEAIKKHKYAVIYAHPHSLISEGPQGMKYFIHFLNYISKLRKKGELWITTPCEVYNLIKKNFKKFCSMLI